VQNGAVVSAYIFEAIATSPQYSIASTKKDVSCIAADPLAPPVASLQMTNVSAATRLAPENTKNYYGDRWRIQDTSSTGVPLTFLQWDLVAPDTSTSTIAPDIPTWAMSAPGLPGSVPQTLEFLDGGTGTGTGPGIFWPCDPTPPLHPPGNPSTGFDCSLSIGTPTTQEPFNIKLLVQNQNPVGAPTPSIAAVSQSVLAPTVYVNGQTGNPISNPINVLTGQGSLTALGAPSTQGNTAGATFQWTFLPSGSANSASIVVPGNVTSFSLVTTYGDGYVAPTVSGAINQTDLVAAFSLQSSTVVTPGNLTVVNLMQKASSAALNNVTYTISPGGPVNATLASCPGPSFCNVTGTATVPAPPVGSYTITLTYNYSGVQGSGQVQTPPPQPFTTVNWVPKPIIGIFYDAGATQLVNCSFGCSLVQGITYHLADTEVLPGGTTYPGANFFFDNGASDTFLSAAGGVVPTTVPFTPSAVCLTGCYVHVLVGGTTVPPAADSQHLGVAIASSTQPLSAAVNGPTNGSVGVPISFTAHVTGGVPPYNYQWACQYAGQFSNFTAGGSSTACTYPSANTYQVAVQVTDSHSTVVTSSPSSIVIGGTTGGGGLAVSVSGPATAPPKTSVTFTAAASGGSGYTFSWTPGESPFDVPQSTGSTPSYSHTYNAAATYTVTCTVFSGNSSAQGTSTVVITTPTTPGPSAAYSISGATQDSAGNYHVESGKSVTFSALETPANVALTNGYEWNFNDGFPKFTQQVVYSFGSVGPHTVTLTVEGDGVNRIGTATSTLQFNVTAPSFQAMLVPSAEHSAPLLDPNGVLKFWATDVSVANPGSSPLTISPAFLSFSAPQGLTFDLSTITFDTAQKVTIPAGGQNSWVDMVKILGGDVANKGTLVLKFEGGSAPPLVTARVYFAPVADPTGPATGSSLPSFLATAAGQVVTQGTQVLSEQDLPGLRGDASYYFRLTLFNSAATGGTFRISAVDDRGVAVTLLDPNTKVPSSGVDFPIGPYQAIDWDNDSLGLNDPARRYVVKAHRTSSAGQLVASAAARDRFTRDQVLVTSDSPPAFQQNCLGSPQQCVNYVLPGASRFQSGTGAIWRTGLSIYNSASLTKRGVAIEYHYQDTALQTPEQVALGFVFLDPGQLLFWDDVVAQVFATVGNNLADPANGTAGILKIIHFADGETNTAPLIMSARNYDDQPTGTVGTELSVYTMPLSLGPNEPSLLLAGVEADGGSNSNPRFETILSVFSFDNTQTTVRLTAVKSDGTVLGFHDLVLNQPGGGGHFQPRNLNISDFNALINEPVTVKVDVMSGGRIGAYALLRDLVTRDPTYIQAVPQN
jgi:PKD repeat protein